MINLKEKTGVQAETILQQAETHIGHAIDVFQAALAKIEQDPHGSPADVEKAARLYLNAIQTLLSIRMKLDDEARRHTGPREYALDLDAARERVRSLLDRLRTADPSA